MAKDLLEGIDLTPVTNPGIVTELDNDKLQAPQPEELLSQTRKFLRDAGHDQQTIDELTTPVGFLPEYPDMASLYDRVLPTFEARREATAEMLKMVQGLKEEGVTFEGDQEILMVNALQRFGTGSRKVTHEGLVLPGFTDMIRTWDNIHRRASDKVGTMVSEAIVSGGLGLGLLDIVARLDKGFLLNFVPPTQREVLHNLVLPKVQLPSGKEHDTGTAAALDLTFQRMYGLAERTIISWPANEVHKAAKLIAASGIPGSEDYIELAKAAGRQRDELQAQGRMRESEVRGQVPALLAGMGQPLGWQEVVERNWDEVTDVGSIYRTMNDLGMYEEMALMAGFFAVGDLVAVPSMAIGATAHKVLPFAQRALRSQAMKVAPEKMSAAAARVARRNFTPEDAIESVADAQKNLQVMQQKLDDEVLRSKEVGSNLVSKEAWARRNAAEEQLNNEILFLNQFKATEVTDEIRLTEIARRHPEWIPNVETTAKALGRSTDPTKKTIDVPPLAAKLVAEHNRLTNVQKLAQEIRKSPLDTTTPVPQVSSKNADTFVKKTLGHEGIATMRALNKRLKEVKEQLPKALEKEPIGGAKKKLVTKTMDEITNEVHAERKRVLENPPDSNIEWEVYEDLFGLQQRAVLGPDDTEAAGTALREMARTGGVSLDDVALPPIAPEYKVVPDDVPLLSWRGAPKTLADGTTPVPAAKDVLNIKRGLQETEAARQHNFFTSTRRAFDQQEEIAKRNLIAAERLGSKDAIKAYNKELANIKKARNNFKKDTPDDFDDSWLAAPAPGIMEDPTRFNKWLETAGDRVMESLYPGGLMYVNNMNKAFQGIAPLREPQRLLQRYDPAAWENLRSAYWSFEQELGAFNNKMREQLVKTGALVKGGKFGRGLKVDAVRSREMFDLSDEEVGSAVFNQLAKTAKPDDLEALEVIRKEFNRLADLQGVGTSDTAPFISGYMRHAHSKSDIANGRRAPEFIGLPRNAEMFASHLMGRTGVDGYPRDIVAALEYYGRAALSKIHLEPAHQALIESSKRMAREYDNPVFQTYMNDFVSQLKGKPTFVGGKIDEWIGGMSGKWKPGALDRTLMGFSSLAYANLLGGNSRYGPMQIGAGLITTASRFGLGRTMKGLMMQATREGQAMSKAAGTYKAYEDIFEGAGGGIIKKYADFVTKRVPAITPFGIMTNAGAESFVRGMTFHTALDAMLTKGGFATFEDAIRAGVGRSYVIRAVRASEEVNHMFGAMGRSPWASRFTTQGVGVSLTQFLSYMPKQTEELLSQFSKNPGKIASYLAVSGHMSRLAAEHLGVNVTDYVGLGYLPKDPSDLTSPAVDILFEGLRLHEAVSSADPEKVSMRGAALTKLMARSWVPLVAQSEQFIRNMSQLESGAVRRPSGDLLREINLPETGRRVNLPLLSGEGVPVPTNLEQLGQFLKPDSPPGTFQVGGEAFAKVFRQPSMREALFERGTDAMRREQRRFFFNGRSLVRDFINAVESGDTGAMDEIAAQLQDTYKVRFTSAEPIERAMQARYMDERLSMIARDKKLIDVFMKIMSEHGLSLEGI
jgi:hypothetical protein